MLHRMFVGLAIVVATWPASAQTHEEYGTRPPHQCGPFTALADEAPTGEEAAKIYVCAQEAEPFFMSGLYLIEDAVLQVGAARPFGVVSDQYLSDADQSRPLHPVRGTLTRVQCSKVYDWQPLYNVGANCNEYPQTAEGTCYRTLFGEWRCALSLQERAAPRMGVAPR